MISPISENDFTDYFLISSIIGEIANNAFDHNLGKWKDQVGCLVSFDFLSDRVRIAVADRGQGIVSSLQVVRPKVTNQSDYLRIAFEEIVSGRAPEQRPRRPPDGERA